MAIIILGDTGDQHAVYMRDYLRSHGADAELVDSRSFPPELTISYAPKIQQGLLSLPGARTLEFSQIRSVYWRNYNGVAASALPDAEQGSIAENDSRSLFESLLISLRARWVNGWHAYQLHQTKPVQLARVAALGISVPETLLSNNPDSVRDFADRHPRCIFKPVQGGAHTCRLTPRHLTAENLAQLAHAPVTLQEEIVGTDTRVFVAGERVLACEIRTDAIDFREDTAAEIVATQLPDSVVGQCRQIAAALELLWTGIDLKRTPDGRFVFLEANPSPMFLGFEQRTGLPLSESLAALLM